MGIITDILLENTSLSSHQTEQFEKYAQMLVEWNEKVNLTAITEPREIAIKHFLDSLSLLDAVEIDENSSLVDVGTGAGFPAIPILIARPDLKITMLDSLNKRLVFLGEVLETLGLNAQLVHMRAEDGGHDKKFREKYDFAVSRAVARLNVLSEYCLPYVKVGGSFVAMKGPDVQEEISEAGAMIGTLGGKITVTRKITLCDGSGRNIITVNKQKNTPKQFPRSSAKIAKGKK